MMLTHITVIAQLALAVAALPGPDILGTISASTVNSEHISTHHVESPRNATLVSRAPNYVCTTLELPTEAEYRINYEDFCNVYFPRGIAKGMGSNHPPVVATYMLRTYTNTRIPWIYKISAPDYGASKYLLNNEKCLAGFKDMLESDKSKQGKDYCVVQGTGGDGESKKLWGEGIVLKMESRLDRLQESEEEVSIFETRKRKGEYTPPGR
ncbi:hypothetical protein E8E13_005208 [Curvularia kusanoi]|uniref:Uncharacterized protein n=1 Tax=Curvularia kusanoi TaxID=90978 RepID=A0A9P4T9Z3_CURKU|nr:hypothetical protein E8E13_005208 [Curvularia kusanoi]